SPEAGQVNPDNLHVLVQHLKCGAFEIPFDRKERCGTEDTPGVLSYLDEQGILHEADGRYHWAAQSFPAEGMSLRTATSDNVVIIDQTDGKHHVIGEVDRFGAPEILYEQAIYLHEAKQFQVERLDWENQKAYVREVKVEYYTQAGAAVPHVRPTRPRHGRRGAVAAHRAPDDLPVRHDARRHRLLRASLQGVRRAHRASARAPRGMRLRIRLSVLRRPGVRARRRRAR